MSYKSMRRFSYCDEGASRCGYSISLGSLLPLFTSLSLSLFLSLSPSLPHFEVSSYSINRFVGVELTERSAIAR